MSLTCFCPSHTRDVVFHSQRLFFSNSNKIHFSRDFCSTDFRTPFVDILQICPSICNDLTLGHKSDKLEEKGRHNFFDTFYNVLWFSEIVLLGGESKYKIELNLQLLILDANGFAGSDPNDNIMSLVLGRVTKNCSL